MIKPGVLPSYSSTVSDPTAIPIRPPPNVKVSPTRPNSLHTTRQEEDEWQTSLQNLEHQMNSYQRHAREGGVTEKDIEGVAQAMDRIASNHTDPKVKAEWKQNAKKFRKANPKEREGVLKGLLKGTLILLTSPLYIMGAMFHATGTFLDGIGYVFKSAGRLTYKMTYMGGAASQRPSRSAPNTQ